MLKFLTAGESHGPALVVIVEGLPAGLKVDKEYIDHELERRKKGYGRGARMAIEKDRAEIISGVRAGVTLGSPVAIKIENKDWANWKHIMDPSEGSCGDRGRVTRPRPGHADLAGGIKYRHSDLRNVLERASARETAARVAAGALAKLLLSRLGVEVKSRVVRIGGIEVPSTSDWPGIYAAADSCPVRCGDTETRKRMIELIDQARQRGDSLGGAFEIAGFNIPPGLGSYSQWDRRLDGKLAQAVMSIPSVKAVEIGDGLAVSSRFGSEAHDTVVYSPERGFYRPTNRAGGLEGGVTNGEVLVVRGFVKPVPTLGHPLPSVDIISKEVVAAHAERSDVCVVPAAAVVGEAMVALVLAGAVMDKFPSDTMGELERSVREYREYARAFPDGEGV